jgi:hypothetical protein
MGRKSLKSFWLPNRIFRGIVCFQWLNSIFVSLCFVHARTDQRPASSRFAIDELNAGAFKVNCPHPSNRDTAHRGVRGQSSRSWLGVICHHSKDFKKREVVSYFSTSLLSGHSF